MQFSLTYRGELKANRGSLEKHRLRMHFHEQLRTLWQHKPLSDCRGFLDEQNQIMGCVRRVGSQRFVSQVTKSNLTLARLSITFLRPGAPGALFHLGGDIDNRLKTLFDALRMPATPQELVDDVAGIVPESVYCLLEDDILIESVSVTTDRLLEPTRNESEVLLLIHVTTRSVNSAELWQAISG